MWIDSGEEVVEEEWWDSLWRLERASTMLSKALRSLAEGEEGLLKVLEEGVVGEGRVRDDGEELAILGVGDSERRADRRLSMMFHRVRNSWTSIKIPAPARGEAARPRSETTTTL